MPKFKVGDILECISRPDVDFKRKIARINEDTYVTLVIGNNKNYVGGEEYSFNEIESKWDLDKETIINSKLKIICKE
jgi:hypothetical protein